MKNIISRISSSIPVSFLGMLTNTNLIIPYYHMVSDEEVLHVKHLYGYKTVREFREDMDFLLKHYHPMGLPDVLDHLRTGRPLPRRSFHLTFDDGFREMSDVVAPILLEKGISATFFVNSAFTDNKELCYLNKASLLAEHFQKNESKGLERKLTEVLRSELGEFNGVTSGILAIRYGQRKVIDSLAQVSELDFGDYLARKEPYLTSEQLQRLIDKGFAVGAHSIDHPLYATLSLEDQLRQTMESIEFVRGTFRLNYGVFAFPHSDHAVSREFFRRLSDSKLVDLSFGTAGLLPDGISTNLQRFSLEKPVARAGRIVAFQHVRKLVKSVTGRALVTRG